MKTLVAAVLLALSIGTAHAEAPATTDDADAGFRDACTTKAPKKLEMEGRHEFIDTCVADTKAKIEADDTKLRDACAKKAPKNLEMSGRHEFVDGCVAEATVKAALAAKPAAKKPTTAKATTTSVKRR